ncbi:MAG: ABC transporter ATP-binding protein [Bianqueaceae bacterium]
MARGCARYVQKINALSFSQIESFGASTLTTRLTNDINQLQQAVAMVIRLVIRAPFVCIGSAVAAMMINARMSIIIFLTLPVLAAIVYFVFRVSAPLYTRVQQKLDALSRTVGENISGVRVIRAFAKNPHEKERFRQRNEELTRAAVRVNLISALVNPLTTFIMNIAIVVVLYCSGWMIQRGQFDQGSVLAFINYISSMLTALLVVANLVVLFTKAGASLKRVNEVLGTELPGEESEVKCERQIDEPAVEFSHVSFSLHSGGESCFGGYYLRPSSRETFRHYRGTGSGKTSVANLILRQYPLTEGRIELWGTDIEAIPREQLLERISTAPQRAELFSGSIRENLQWGAHDAEDADLQKALKAAQASDFVGELPQKLDSQVDRGGRNFSGGQKQRLNIARALVKNAPLLILDDSFSALDYLTEHNLKTALKEQYPGTTLLIISQRVSSIRGADQILVLDDGKMAGLAPMRN